MIKNIFIGIKTYSRSLHLINSLKLWKYFAIPMLISLVTAIIIGFLAYGLSDNIGFYIAKIWVWEWGKEGFITFSNLLGAATILILGLILYKHIIMALSAPFMGPISEKIEAHLNDGHQHAHRTTTFKEQLWRGIRINVRNLLKELMITIPIILIGLIPIIGFFASLLVFLIQAYYAGFGNMDYTLERHFKYRESIVFVRKHRGIAIGNGILFMLFLLVPVLGIILVLPLSVTAATINTVDLLKNEKPGIVTST